MRMPVDQVADLPDVPFGDEPPAKFKEIFNVVRDARMAARSHIPPHRYCQATPAVVKLLPVRVETPLLA